MHIGRIDDREHGRPLTYLLHFCCLLCRSRHLLGFKSRLFLWNMRLLLLALTYHVITAFLRQIKLFCRFSTERELQLERVLLSD